MTPKAGSLSAKLGYSNVRVMLEGIPAWKNAGHIVTASKQFVTTGNIVLVDLRSKEEYEAGHIPRAINVPLATLADWENDFPLKAPIVVYGASDDDGRKAFNTIKKWGAKTGSVWAGGTASWTALGSSLAQGPSPAAIDWVRTPAKGEVSVADFKKVAAGDSSAIILDVRENNEIGDGMFKNAIHVPLSTLATRTDELPRDREMLIHCVTGGRAELAWQVISKAGLKSRFVVGNVACKNNMCSIEE